MLEGSSLAGFLAETSTAAALEIWLGPELLHLLRHPSLLRQRFDREIAAIDELVSRQVSAVLRHERFRALEAAWRGVHFLTDTVERGERIKVRVLDASWKEVVSDFDRAPDFDQSTLFDLIYTKEFDTPGGEPFGLIVGNYFVNHGPTQARPIDDVAALKGMAQAAAAAFAPFVTGCDPTLLGLDGFESLGTEVDLDSIFRQDEYDRWRRLREVEDGRFLGLCMPRVLLRDAWGKGGDRRARFCFTESPTPEGEDSRLWGNGAFAFGAVVIRAFAQSGWFAEIRGARRGEAGAGLVPNLPTPYFGTDAAPIAFRHPVEIAVSDRQERRLSELGFIPVSVAEYVPAAVFYSNQSLYRAPRHSTAAANANARLSCMLQYVLCVARFAHAVKMIGRDRIGDFTTAAECQGVMQKWLADYVTANQNASLELKIRHPLREGKVTVAEDPGRPGKFKLDIYLRPHLQLDDISTGIRLTTELSAARAA
ncbi:MAG TPA: type VI secretion system contractile sheath large subunit [Steroidobacteraceae bacterium]|jgi:type VI secretion system protein ImpD